MFQLAVIDGLTKKTIIADESANDSQSELEKRISLYCDKFEISIEVAHRMDAVFDYEFYQKNYHPNISCTDKSCLVDSFLSQEAGSTVTISPFVEITLLQQHFSKLYDIEDNGSWTPGKLIALWLDSQLDEIDPWYLFDRAFYCKNNPDVADSDYSPFLHFIDHGAAEGRIPSEHFGEICSHYLENLHPIDYRKMIRGIPYVFQKTFLTTSALEQIHELFMPEIYIAGTTDDINSSNAFGHFLIHGSDNSVRPSILFNRCLLYTSPSPRDLSTSRMPSSA